MGTTSSPYAGESRSSRSRVGSPFPKSRPGFRGVRGNTNGKTLRYGREESQRDCEPWWDLSRCNTIGIENQLYFTGTDLMPSEDENDLIVMKRLCMYIT